MKKILVLTTVHKWNDNRILFKEIESLKKLDAEIHYSCQYDKDTDFIENGVYFHPLPKVNSLFKRLFFLQSLSFIKIRTEKFDIIHFHDPELIILMWIVKFLFNPKVVFDIHENVSESLKTRKYIPKILRNFVSSSYSLIEKMVISNFDTFIIAEKSYRKIYGEKAIEILNYPRIEKELEKKYTNPIKLVYSGGITEERGIWVVLDIFKSLQTNYKAIKLNLIGEFETKELQEQVNNFISKNRLENNVEIFGRVPISKVNEILKECHIGFSILQPVGNYVESLPTKIFDYMNNKVVVVCNDFPLYKSYVEKNKTGITINYYNYKNEIKKISEIIEKNDLLVSYSINGYQMINQKWNWNEEEKKLFEIYNKV